MTWFPTHVELYAEPGRVMVARELAPWAGIEDIPEVTQLSRQHLARR